MKTLIACLGYDLEANNKIPKILESRLVGCIELCKKHPNSTLLLLGSSSFRDDANSKSQSSAMKEYVEYNAKDIRVFTKIIIEEETSSTVEQLCYLKEWVMQEPEPTCLIIMSSEFFVDRVKLYSEYIFGTLDNIQFGIAKVPDEIKDNFKAVELEKLNKAQKWLSQHKRGDYKTILHEQKEFQQKIISSEIEHQRS